MNSGVSLYKNTLIYSVGTFGSKLISFLIVPLYSFYLTKAQLGYYDLVLTTISLAVPFITVQIADAAYRWLLEDPEGNRIKQTEIITTGSIILLFSYFIFSILFAIISLLIETEYKLLFFIILIVSSTLPYLQRIIRGLGHTQLYAIVGILAPILLLVFSSLFLYFSKDKLFGLLVALVASNSLVILVILLKSRVYKFYELRSFNIATAKELLSYSLPLIPNAISWWMINAANRYIILSYLGADFNGVFAISNKFPSIILIINSVFMLAWQDHILNDTQNKQDYTRYFKTFMTLQLSIVLFLVAISKYLVKYLVDPKFFDSWQYMPFLMLGVAFSSFSAFLGSGYIKLKDTKGLFVTTIVGGIVNIVTTILLIQKIGLFAPALGTLIGFAVLWIIRINHTNSLFNIEIDKTLLAVLLVFIFISMYLVFINVGLVDYSLIAISLLLTFFFNKDLFEKLFNKITKLVLK
ncbi:Membrane protein involved in the export of O-antigen and teichoic acid [Dyadobacter koreensis]|uniref:Membrane protein involved in the export of O-antigen and teichoic acid n=1 Tax=Dyadobacter koreensis TaxID=408657 RepID=A0A1H6Q8K8_9BACT|nr:oligosaccharide flippase family protein [Dyadobacter koreensis]SEI40141.1 Membrane protein involved in the export of O-antigen and teichoic acid [Dyadobacter koreensis]